LSRTDSSAQAAFAKKAAARKASAENVAQPVRLLNKREILAITGLTFPTIWKMMRAGTFPRSRVVGQNGQAFTPRPRCPVALEPTNRQSCQPLFEISAQPKRPQERESRCTWACKRLPTQRSASAARSRGSYPHVAMPAIRRLWRSRCTNVSNIVEHRGSQLALPARRGK
jgi:predicted DNA-binding transcriptional regulator AlpA